MNRIVKDFNNFERINEAKTSGKKELEETLEAYKKEIPELEKFILHNADARLGKKVALAVESESGSINTKTEYMSYKEMEMFLLGYLYKHENRFRK